MTRTRTFGSCMLLAALWLALPLRPVDAEEAAGAPSPRAVEAMRLLDSADLYQRQLGFLRLEALRETATVDRIRHYITDKDPDVRAYSLRALAAIQGAQAVPTLLKALSDKHPRVRRSVIQGLEPLVNSSPEILQIFISRLKDRNPQVRMAVIDALSRIASPRAQEAILLHRRREHNRDVKRVLNATIKRLGW